LKKHVIIVAAGAGKRFGENLPKQFEMLQGKPLLMNSIQAFHEAEPGIKIIVVIPNLFLTHWKTLCNNHDFHIPHEIAEGGPERFHSVKNGLEFIGDEGLVAVHDGARPLISKEKIRNSFRLAEKFGAVVPVVEVNDSVRIITGSMHKPAARKNFRLVQTPQVFRCSLLKRAYQQNYDVNFTDDATVVEAAGEKVILIEGSTDNIKITTPHDLTMAEALLKAGTFNK